MKQTAVQWLYENILINPMYNEDVIYNEDVLEMAKEMEKQQLIEAYDKAQYDYDLMRETNSEQYYNETFKSE